MKQIFIKITAIIIFLFGILQIMTPKSMAKTVKVNYKITENTASLNDEPIIELETGDVIELQLDIDKYMRVSTYINGVEQPKAKIYSGTGYSGTVQIPIINDTDSSKIELKYATIERSTS